MKKEMLINVLQPEECRIAIMEDGVLEELYVERTNQESYVGNIYKGRIVNIEPSIQAAFVDFGVGRNGFLHVSDVEPAYYRHLEQRRDGGGPRGRGRDRFRGPQRPRRDEAPPPSQPTAATAPEDPFDLFTASDSPLPEYPDDDITDAASQLAPDDTVAHGEIAPRDESPADASPALESEPGRQEQAQSGRRGRSRRGRGHGQARDSRESTQSSGATTSRPAAQESSPKSEPPAEAHDPHSEPPRYMDSAERRTGDDDPPPYRLESKPNVSDDDLFFPRSDASAPAEISGQEPEREFGAPRAAWEKETAAPGPAQAAEEDQFRPEPAPQPMDDEFPVEGQDARRRRRPQRDDRSGGRRGGPRRGPARPGMGRPKPLIQDIFKRGQEVLVQVIKEGLGTKGPTLSTYISIAGRYLVLMPGLNRIGVSRKIADDEHRRRLREILNELQPPKGLGFIIRTAGLDKNKKELQRDLAYLSRLWQVVVRRIRKLKSPAEIYQESDMITRTIRDTFTNEIDTIWVDENAAFEHAQEFLQIVMPRYANRIRHYNDPEPLFHKHGIENEIARIQQRHVPLPNGGSIVIDQTEALVAIDVNSGNFRADNNAEETAYQMNLQAAKEIARQLRLRDLGGVIVNDFIDMREEKHRRGVERAMREAVKRDRARTKILKISAFGLIEMTRQRIRPSLKRSVYQDCPHCGGTGQVKTCESMSIDVMRMLQLAAHHKNVHNIQVRVAEEVAHNLLNKKRKEIARLEEAGQIQVSVSGVPGAAPESLDFICFDNNNNEIKFYPQDEIKSRRR
jgi:ribonuclease E